MKNTLTTLNHQPAKLIYGIDNPEEAMAQIFEQFELHEARAALFEFYKSWVNDNIEAADGENHAEMLRFYSCLLDLINGAFLHIEKERNVVG